MEFKEIAPSVEIPALGLGTWRIGGGETADYSRDEQDTLTLQKGIELGYTHIDTAEYYGNGHCEEIVGRAITSFDRSSIFLTTKVWHNHLTYDKLIKSLESSLKRLEQDYVDLYLIHWPNENVPIEETMKALEHCIDEGYTRFIGVSNFSTRLLEEAQSTLKENRLIANQVKYNLIEQGPKTEHIPYCVENDITLIAYTPLARGILTRESNPVLVEMVEKYDKSPAQISLNWLISQENVITIPKASRLEHLRDNLGAVGWRMDAGDVDTLSKSFTQTG